ATEEGPYPGRLVEHLPISASPITNVLKNEYTATCFDVFFCLPSAIGLHVLPYKHSLTSPTSLTKRPQNRVFYHTNGSETRTDPNVTNLQEEANHIHPQNGE
ncbi:hypothetical protein STEG23_032474, partial [Scotinomys teguina]